MEEGNKPTTTQTDATWKVAIIGASGAVGAHLVKDLVGSNNITKVVSFGRKELQIDDKKFEHEKLEHHIVDMSKIAEESSKMEKCDASYCCLGTTRRDAGSAEAFRKIDFDIVVDFAKASKKAEIPNFHLVSSTGASANSWFLYPKTKGEAENAIKDLGFQRTIIYRPGLMDRGDKARTVEKLAKGIMGAIKVETVAKAMYNLSLKQMASKEGDKVAILENAEIKKAAL